MRRGIRLLGPLERPAWHRLDWAAWPAGHHHHRLCALLPRQAAVLEATHSTPGTPSCATKSGATSDAAGGPKLKQSETTSDRVSKRTSLHAELNDIARSPRMQRCYGAG